MGSDSNSSTRSDTTNNTNIVTTNTDRRATVGNGALSASGDNSSVYSNSSTIYDVNDPDAVKAIAQMGTDTIKSTGGAVVELMESAGTNNAAAWSNTIGASERMLDKIIGQVYQTSKTSEQLAVTAMNNYQPTDNKAVDANKYIGMAAVAVAAAMVLQGAK